MPFVPESFIVPPGLTAQGLELIPLRPEHNEPDYEAWTTSAEHIHNTPGFDDRWPHEMTLEENHGDLERHWADFLARQGFTYTVRQGGRTVGCVYIYPDGDEGAAKVKSWVRADTPELDVVLYRVVQQWLDDAWPFEDVRYAAR
jgi:hypothetical protein